MQITLNQDEIFVAIEQYVRAQITVNDDQEIDIDLKAGRGENGHSATLDIRPAKPSAKKTAKPAVVRTAKPDPAPKGEPETEEDQTETADESDQTESDDVTSDEDADKTPGDGEAKPRSSIFSKAS